MITYIRQKLALRHFTYFNETCRERGWDHIQLPPQPWRRFIPSILRQIRDEAREKIAFRIAPWLKPEDYD